MISKDWLLELETCKLGNFGKAMYTEKTRGLIHRERIKDEANSQERAKQEPWKIGWMLTGRRENNYNVIDLGSRKNSVSFSEIKEPRAGIGTDCSFLCPVPGCFINWIKYVQGSLYLCDIYSYINWRIIEKIHFWVLSLILTWWCYKTFSPGES